MDRFLEGAVNVIITFKLSPTDEADLETLPDQYATFRESMEAGAKFSLFGPRDRVELRWLLTTGKDDNAPLID